MADNVLEIKDLVVHYETDDGCVEAVNGLSISIGRERTLGWWVKRAPERPPQL